jgi:hypothetical protein
MRSPWLLPLLVTACNVSPPAPPLLTAVPPGAVAVCAGRAISPVQVTAVASARAQTPRQALEALASDARAATEAERQGVGDEPLVRQRIDAALSRALLERLRAESTGPTTAAELDNLRRERWLLFDRPAGARVIHAVVRKPDSPDARRIAEAIAAAVQGSPDAAAFEQRALAVPHADIEVKVETLSPVSADGRTLDESGNHFDATFAAAACALTTPLSLSPVIATPFGYHVMLLLERTPPLHVDDATMALQVRDEVVARRGHESLTRLLTTIRTREEVLLSRNAAEVLQALDQPRAKR